MSFHGETMTVIRPHWTTQRGDTVADWTNAREYDIPGCEVQPLSITEVTTTGTVIRQGVADQLRVWAGRDADITEHDRARYRGEVYDVTGVQVWDSPVGRLLAHTEITLRRMEG